MTPNTVPGFDGSKGRPRRERTCLFKSRLRAFLAGPGHSHPPPSADAANPACSGPADLSSAGETLAQQSQVFQLRQWLLLALRLLLLLLLVLTFLKPTLTAPLGDARGGARVRIIVLDTSLSMGYQRNGVSSLARLRGHVASLLDDLGPGDQFNVILAGATPHPLLPQPGQDAGLLRQALQEVTAGEERGDMTAALAAAVDQFARAGGGRKELFLASDFQRTNWSDVKFDALPGDVNLVFLNAEEGDRPNAAVTGLKLRPSVPRAQEEGQIEAEVWNGAPTAHTVTVTFLIDREEAGAFSAPTSLSASLTVPPYASGTATVPFTFPDPGQYRVSAHLPPDNLPADDGRYLTVDLRHTLSVVLLTDKSAGRHNRGLLSAACSEPCAGRAGRPAGVAPACDHVDR